MGLLVVCRRRVLVAGDDEAAKSAFIALVDAAGLHGVDAGSLKRTVKLEALGFLQIALINRGKTSAVAGFTLVS